MWHPLGPFLLLPPLLLSGCAHAHPLTIGSYEELRTVLKSGDRVEIITSAGAHSGTVESVAADSLTILTDGARHQITETAIARLKRRERLVRRSALNGLAIGMGMGAAIATFSDCMAGETSCLGTRISGTLVIASVGAGLGAAAGLKSQTTLIYAPSNGDRPTK
jgi:hypothetical protein